MVRGRLDGQFRRGKVLHHIAPDGGGELFRGAAAGLAAGGGPLGLLARAVLAAGAVFLGGGALRAALDRPRPYQQPGFVPLLPKDTLGRSFPSRHALSAGAIAAAWLPVCPAASALLGALTLALCAARVLAGVHTPADVLAGAALGFGLAALGMCLPL